MGVTGAFVELGEKLDRVLSVLEIRGVKPRLVIVGDEAAVKGKMLIEPLGEVCEAQSILEEPHPGLQHELLVAYAHELDLAKCIVHNMSDALLKGDTPARTTNLVYE